MDVASRSWRSCASASASLGFMLASFASAGQMPPAPRIVMSRLWWLCVPIPPSGRRLLAPPLSAAEVSLTPSFPFCPYVLPVLVLIANVNDYQRV